jgi:hypothetical protein
MKTAFKKHIPGLLMVIAISSYLPILKSCATDGVVRKKIKPSIATETSSSILEANPQIRSMSESRLNRLSALIDETSARHGLLKDDSKSFAAAAALTTEVLRDQITLKWPRHVEAAATASCPVAKEPKKTKAEIARAQKAPKHPAKKSKLSPEEASEERFTASLKSYAVKVSQLSCYVFIVSDGMRASNHKSSGVEGLFSKDIAKGLASPAGGSSFFIPRDARPSDEMAYGSQFRDHADGLIAARMDVFRASAETEASLATPAHFYDETVLFHYFKNRFDLSDVMAMAYLKTATNAAARFKMTEREARDWMAALDIQAKIAAKTNGRAGGPAYAAHAEFAASCGFPDATPLELSQLSLGFLTSACAFKSHRLETSGYHRQLVSFIMNPPGLVTPAKDSGVTVLRSRLSLQDKSLMTQAAVEPKPETETYTAGDFDRILSLMEIVQTPARDGTKERTAHLIETVGTEVFSDLESRRDWYIVLGIESKFLDGLTSPTGARGYGQLIMTYHADFGKRCGFFDTKKEDILEARVNLMLSACYFRMLQDSKPFVSQALVAYNAGPNSRDLRAFEGLGTMGLEPANYVSRYQLIRERLEASERRMALLFEKQTASK